jgi:hypothetical protein
MLGKGTGGDAESPNSLNENQMKAKFTIKQFVPNERQVEGTIELNGSSSEEEAEFLFMIEQKLNAMTDSTIAVRAHIEQES